MKQFIFILLFFVSFAYADDFMVIDEPTDAYTQVDHTDVPEVRGSGIEVGSVDTSDQPARGSMISEVNFYENGGVESRVVVGIFDLFSIGVSEKVDALIGSSMPVLNIPAAFLKFSLFPTARPLNLALGFNRFAYGQNGNVDVDGNNIGTQYGMFLSSSVGYTLFELPHLTTLGLRMPLLPNSFRGTQNISMVFATQLRWKWFEIGLTLENLYFDVTRLDQSVVSAIVSFHLIESLTVEGVFVGELDGGGIHRLLNVKYTMQF